MNKKVLCVDDELHILEGYKRVLRKEFEIDTAVSGRQGVAAVMSEEPYAVIVADMRMPGMDGIQFLSNVKELAPNTIRIMLTGNADQQTAIEAVNEGNIFRFLTKPCSPENLAKALHAGIDQYRLVMVEKDLLEKTLRGSIQVLTDILSLVNPTAFGHAARVRRLVSQVAATIKLKNAWRTEIAAMLSQIGCITVPGEILEKSRRGETLTPEELRMMQSHPQIGRDLIARIPRLGQVAEIIAYQDKCFDGSGFPDDDKREQDIPLGARILKIVLDFDKLVEAGVSNFEAVEQISKSGDLYDPLIIEALKATLVSDTDYEIKAVEVGELKLNMVFAEDVFSTKGVMLITGGQEATKSLCVRLENLSHGGEIVGPIKVLVPINREVTATVSA